MTNEWIEYYIDSFCSRFFRTIYKKKIVQIDPCFKFHSIPVKHCSELGALRL